MMNYCRNCGIKLNPGQDVCLNCGIIVNPDKDIDGKNKLLYGILGFFLPVVGLILFILWKEERPKSAKAAGTGALIATASAIIFAILMFIFVIIMGILIGLSF